MRLQFPAVVALAVLGAAVPAHATEYWTLPKLLGEFFAGAERVTFKKVSLSDADAAAIEKKLGVKVKRDWSVYFGLIGGKRTGYALWDSEIGLHEPIDFGVRFGLAGAVERVEIMAYREPFGEEVRQERFRRKFVGKTAADPITAGQDIDIISGATYSSRSVALGVKRDTLVLDAALKNGL